MTRRRTISVALVLFALAAGCGNQQIATAQEEWGEGYCQATLDYHDRFDRASGSPLTPDNARAYASALEALGPPPGVSAEMTNAYHDIVRVLGRSDVAGVDWMHSVGRPKSKLMDAAVDEIPSMKPGFLGDGQIPEETACAELQALTTGVDGGPP